MKGDVCRYLCVASQKPLACEAGLGAQAKEVQCWLVSERKASLSDVAGGGALSDVRAGGQKGQACPWRSGWFGFEERKWGGPGTVRSPK